MDKQKIYQLISVVLILTTSFFFLRWLYMADAAESEALGLEQNQEALQPIETIYTYFINQVIPAAKVSYEKKYGYMYSDPLSTFFGNMTGSIYTDIRNPLTYFNVAFSAFGTEGQGVFDSKNNVSQALRADGLPDVKSFSDAPEGAVYFSEEDEYKADDTSSADKTAQDTAPKETAAAEANIAKPAKLKLDPKLPQILIYHTHTMESYMPNTAENYHTLSEKYNVLNVGNALAETLKKKYKYNVIHDKTYHDKQSYVYSYTNSNLTIKKNIQKYPSLKIILDLHRDAFDISRGGTTQKKNEYTTTINGKKAARIMLVIGQGNPNYKELEKYAVYIKNKMEKMYPGLFLKIDRKPVSKYNEYYSNYSMLVEVGCMLNTDAEAKYSGELLGNVIGEVLKDLKE